MAIIRRTRNPWKRSIMALRSARGTVFVLRHGTTDRNRGGVGLDLIRGHADVPMTPGGEHEVQVTAWGIGPERIARVYASDLQRATRSAEILSDENVGYPPVEPTASLRSWDMGPSMEGRVTTPDVVEQIEEWVRNDTIVPPGGESFSAYVSRVISFVAPIFAAAVGGETVALVAHGRVVQIIDFWVAAGCDEACMRSELAEYLVEEPDTVPPGGGIRYKHDGLGWLGVVLGSGVPSMGTQIASGAHRLAANEMAQEHGAPPS